MPAEITWSTERRLLDDDAVQRAVDAALAHGERPGALLAVVLLDDATATYSEADHQATLSNIDRNFGQVATIADVVDAWGSGAPAESQPAARAAALRW